MTDIDIEGAEDEVVPDYSRVGFRQLQALCKDRGLPGDGNSITLIERLKAWDAQHGKDVDLSAAENLAPDEPDDDPLGLDEPDEPTSVDNPTVPTPEPPPSESPVGAVPAASVPAPTGTPPRASRHGGRPDMTVTTGVVKVGEGHGGTAARGYRHAYPVGPRDVTDADHFTYIEATHAAANAAGHQTRGGGTAGHRVGYTVDADGRRVVVYQVTLRRQQ